MDIVSFSFLLFALAAILSLRLVTAPRMRPALVLLLNAVFFASFLHHPADAWPVLGMMALGYGCLLVAGRKSSRIALGLMIAAVILLFIWLKRYTLIASLLPVNTTPLMVVGLSYILFRILHLLIDVAQGVRPAPSLLSYVNYCLFFPTFLSGPIARYEQFEAGMIQAHTPLTVPQFHAALTRIMLGLMLLVVVSAYAGTMADFIQTTRSLAMPDHTAWIKTTQLFSLTAFATFIKLYTNFCGSMHIVIGMAALAGFTLPENFNKPYLARNFLDFWARWHITLSEWIKYYLFNPLLTALTKTFPSRRAATAVGAVAFFIAFFIIGIWHGTTPGFAVFGVMLGLAASVNKLWQQFLTRLLGKKDYKTLTQRNWYFQLSRGMTLAYIALALASLWVDPAFVSRNGAAWCTAIALLSLVMMTVGLTIIGTIADAVYPLLAQLRMPRSEYGMACVMALMALVVLNHVGAYGSGTPELVYKGF